MPNFPTKQLLARFNSGFLSARIGEWLFTVALNWMVYVDTQSPLLLAVINACRLVPNLLFSVPAGSMADRFDRKTLNMITAILDALLALSVGVVLYYQWPFWLCALLVVARAIVGAAEGPFRNAYMCNLFEGAQLKSVVAQNASVMNLGRIVGPVVAGTMLVSAGSFATFVAAAFCIALYAISLWSMPRGAELPTLPPPASSQAATSFSQLLTEHPCLKNLLKLAIPVMFFGFPFTAMLPLLTESVLGLGSQEFGTLLAASAAGALLASWRLSRTPNNSTWCSTRNYAMMFGASLLALIGCFDFYSAAIVLFIVGYLGQAYRTSSRMLYQEIVPREKAGKLLGLALMDRGIIPFGGLLIGAVAEVSEPKVALSIMGLGCMVSVLSLFHLSLPPIPRPLIALGLAGGLLAILSGCQAQEQSTTSSLSVASTRIEHDWGTTEVPLNPQRIVVLDLPFLDAFTALEQPVAGFAGTSDKIVPAYLQDSLPGDSPPLFVGERKQPNLEVILSLKPDLIVANPDRHKMIRQQLETIAPTVALNDNSFQQIKDMMAILAFITGRNQECQNVEAQLSSEVAAAKESQIGRPTVLVVGAFEDEFSTWTEQSFIGTLLSEVGADYLYKGKPGASESQTEVAKITVESLAEYNPDFLFVYGNPDDWDGHVLYQKMRAYKEDRILKIDRDLWSRARGPLAAQLILKEYGDFISQKIADPAQE